MSLSAFNWAANNSSIFQGHFHFNEFMIGIAQSFPMKYNKVAQPNCYKKNAQNQHNSIPKLIEGDVPETHNCLRYYNLKKVILY